MHIAIAKVGLEFLLTLFKHCFFAGIASHGTAKMTISLRNNEKTVSKLLLNQLNLIFSVWLKMS